MSVFDKNRNQPSSSSQGSVFDRKPVGASSGPGSVFDRKPAGASSSPGSVFDKKSAVPPSSVFTNNNKPADTKGKKFGAPVWHGPVELKAGTKNPTKQSKTMLMMQQMIDDGEGDTVPNAFNQAKGADRPKYQRVENKQTIDQQLYGVTGNEGLENSKYDPFREDYGPTPKQE